jgi:CHAT domain-containing protein
LRPRHLGSIVQRHFIQLAIRRTLYNQLIAPAAEQLQGRRRVYLVPHGPLHYIPFHALIAPDGGTLLREDGPQFIYAPSASILFRHRPSRPDHALEPGLALGYNGAGATRLRFAEEEARSVAHLIGGQAVVGRRLKKAALYERAAHYRLLHLSCHGTFDPEAPLASALHLGPGETLTALNVLEHLRLHCDLVTLSACESGLSRVRRGDELVGLVRAFMYAGAAALICTLWRVDERSTHILMEKFYQEVQRGVGFAQALKRAQLYLRSLSRREALEILTRAPTPATGRPGNAAGERVPRTPALSPAHAGNYLKGLAPQGTSEQTEALLHGADDDLVFADPYYWAPFVLIGEHGSS